MVAVYCVGTKICFQQKKLEKTEQAIGKLGDDAGFITEEIKQKLTIIFKEVFEEENIVVTEQMTAADVANWDSLSNVMMIVKVEKTFNIKLKLKEIINMKNVGDLITGIQDHTS